METSEMIWRRTRIIDLRFFLTFSIYMVVGWALYLNSVDNSFHYDDRYVIVENREIANLKRLPSVFYGMELAGSDKTHQVHYRPIVYASYMVNYAIGGLDPAGYHVVNILIHILVAFLVAVVMERLTGRLMVGALSGLLFLVHPFNAEAVNYVTARSSQLYTLFYLLAFYAYLRYRPPLRYGVGESTGEPLREGPVVSSLLWLCLSLLCFALAMLSKEMAVTLPVTLFLYEWLIGPAKGWRDRLRGLGLPGAVVLAVVVSYLIIRRVLVGSVLQTDMGYDLVRKLSTQGVVLVRTIGLILWPAGLTIDHKVESYDSFAAGPVAGAYLVLVGLLGLCLWWIRSNNITGRLKVFLLLWYFIVLSPVVIIPLNAMLQENRAYLAGVGIISLAAISLDWLLNWSRRKAPVFLKTVWTGILVLVLICATLTIQRNIIWQDDISLWTDAVLKNPGSSEAHLGMGAAYHERKNLDLAVKEYQEALIIKPEDYRAIGNLAQIYRQQGRYDLAIAAYWRVIRLVPGDPKAHYGLGLTYQLAGQLGLAVQEYQKALALDPANERALFSLENIHTPSGKLRDTETIFQRSAPVDRDSLSMPPTKDGLTRY